MITKTEIKLPYEALIPYPDNAKLHPLDQIAKLAASIDDYGLVEPIIVDADNVILAGHGRYLACGKLGLKIIDCVRVCGLSEQEKMAYRIYDNSIASETGVDPSKLGIELSQLADSGMDLSFYGLSISKPEGQRSADIDTTSEKKQAYDAADEKQLVFYFFPAQYEDVLRLLNDILKQHPVDSFANAILHLLNCDQKGVFA